MYRVLLVWCLVARVVTGNHLHLLLYDSDVKYSLNLLNPSSLEMQQNAQTVVEKVSYAVLSTLYIHNYPEKDKV